MNDSYNNNVHMTREEGEEVYAQNFGSGEKWIPARVIKVLGPHSVKVELLG